MNLTKEKAIELLEISEKAHHETIEENRQLKKQLDEARKVIKLYATTKVGHLQPDGTYHLIVVGGTASLFSGFQTYQQEYVYDPRPARNYLKKWRKR